MAYGISKSGYAAFLNTRGSRNRDEAGLLGSQGEGVRRFCQSQASEAMVLWNAGRNAGRMRGRFEGKRTIPLRVAGYGRSRDGNERRMPAIHQTGADRRNGKF